MKKPEGLWSNFSQEGNSCLLTASKVISLTFVLLCVSCVPSIDSPSSGGRESSGGSGSTISNNPNSVSTGFGRILADNPIILSGNPALGPGTNLNTLLRPDQTFITTDQFLNRGCIGVDQCFSVTAEQNALPLQNPEKKWAYDANSIPFLEVNTFGHMGIIIDKWLKDVEDFHSFATFSSFGFLPNGYKTALPSNLFLTDAHWKGGLKLQGYADCDVINNAFYNPATFSLCFGTDREFESVKFAQDNTVIYHEIGHTFQDIMVNMRTIASGTVIERSEVGSVFYDEAGSIGEGLADYYSYYVNGRPHFGEWALGSFNIQSRPLSEDDPLHAPGISTLPTERLAYPQYLNYDPNEPDKPFEDVHYAGQIISHYLVALTEDLKNQCFFTQEEATGKVLFMVAETFAELGDLSSRGTDYLAADNRVNLNPDHALEWLKTVMPINFRSFTQGIAKNLYQVLGDPALGLCNGSFYSKDRIESLLDEYGLLLFKTYNENGNSSTEPTPLNFNGHAGISTPVNPANRKKTVLIKKDLIKMDSRNNTSKAFVFDKRSDMVGALQALQASGQIGDVSTLIDSDLPYNNGNAQISPGEFLGISLNLFNDSNSPMAGVQLLANDWDHMKEGAPCNTFDDQFPIDSEGAAQLLSGEGVAGGCDYVTRANGDDNDLIAPICVIQQITGSSSTWVGQNEYRESINLDENFCLAGSVKTDDCFLRFVKGADQAWFSKIDPKKTWGESISAANAPVFNFSNIVFMEVNPNTPPGTTFHCRFRVRFTNCDDCFTDANEGDDDFLNHEYSGDKPFKIIPFQFTVID